MGHLGGGSDSDVDNVTLVHYDETDSSGIGVRPVLTEVTGTNVGLSYRR